MSANVSPFRDEKYVADKNFIGHYHDQMSFLLAKEYDVDVEDIKPLDIVNLLEKQKKEVCNDRIKRIKNLFFIKEFF